MNFAILAAGEGSRLRQEGIQVPKGMVKLNSITLVERLIRICERMNPESISIIVNEQSLDLADHIINTCDPKLLNIKIKSTKSSMHSLYELRNFLRDDNFCLFTVDSIFKENEFKEYLQLAKENQNYDACLAVTNYIDDEKPLYIRTNSSDEITAFLDEKEDTNLVSGGIYYFSPKVFEILEYCIENNMHRLRNFQRMLIEKGLNIKAFKFSKIIDVDHVSDIKKAEAFLGE